MRMGKLTGVAAGALALTMAAGTAAQAQGAGSWNGFYIGAHGGWVSSKTTDSDAGSDGSLSIKGGVGGGHLGYNWQMQGMVVGVELDASATGIRKKEQDGIGTATFNQTSLMSARLRLGVSPMPNLLVYATGGIGYTNLKFAYSEPGFSASASGSKSGFVGGGGLEYKISSALSLRGEVLYYSISDLTLKFSNTDIAKLDNGTTVVRAGLTFHLN
jgi:outer membrane immunogenic protein